MIQKKLNDTHSIDIVFALAGVDFVIVNFVMEPTDT